MIKKLIEELPSDQYEAFLNMEDFYSSNKDELPLLDLLHLMNAFKIVLEPILNTKIDTDIENMVPSSVKFRIEEIICIALPKVSESIVVRAFEDKNANSWLTKQQREDIQLKINELRESIIESETFKAEHKQRLLALLEELQQELHKKISDYDLIMSKLLRAARTLGQIGTETKPFIDRIKEIVNIFGPSAPDILQLPPTE